MGDLRQKAELVIRINGEDHILPLQDAVHKRMDQIAARTRDTGAATDRWGQSLLTGGERLAVFTSGLQAAFAIASRVASAIGSIPSQIEEAGVDQALTAQFERAFGAAAEGVRELLREATGGQIDTSGLEQLASRAQRMGLSVKDTAEALNLAVKAANATGRENAATADAILSSLTKGNERALQGLGINLDLDAAYEAQARHLGVTVASLTESQRHAVVLEQTSAALAKNFGEVQISGTVIAQARQLGAAVEEARDEWNKLKADGFLFILQAAGMARGSADRVNEITDRVNELADTLGMVDQAGRRSSDVLVALVQDNETAAQALLGRMQKEVQERATLAAGLRGEAVDLRDLATAKADTENHYGITIGWLTRETIARNENAAAIDKERAALEAKQALEAARAARSAPGGIDFFPEDRTRIKLRKPTGGGRTAKREEEMGPPREAFELQERLAAEERVFAEQNLEFDRQMRQEMMDADAARAESLQRLADAMRSTGDVSLAMAAAFASSFEGAGAAVAGSGQIIVSEMDRINAVLQASKKATGDTAAGWKAAVPGMLAASGKLAAGFIDDEKGKAGVLAVMEGAAAIASFAAQDYLAGALHTASAIQYGLIAGGVIGGAGAGGGARGGGRAGGRPALDRGAQEPPETARPVIVTYNLQGVVTQEGAREIDRMSRRDRSERFAGNPEWMPG